MSSLSATTRSSNVAFMTSLPRKLYSAPQDGVDQRYVDIGVEGGQCNASLAHARVSRSWRSIADASNSREGGRRFNSPAVQSPSRRCRAGKQALLNDGVDAPVAVDHLSHAEIDADGNQRNRLILRQPFGRHQETAHLAERVPQREIDRRLLVDILLRRGAELFEIVGEAETVQDPFVLSFKQRII